MRRGEVTHQWRDVQRLNCTNRAWGTFSGNQDLFGRRGDIIQHHEKGLLLLDAGVQILTLAFQHLMKRGLFAQYPDGSLMLFFLLLIDPDGGT